MMKWMSAVVLAAAVMAVGAGRIEPAAAAASQSAVRGSLASDSRVRPTDVSARRHARRYHQHYRYGYRQYPYGYRQGYGYRPYYPRYYARPSYYEPDPYYAPFPFGFSFGFGRW